MMIGLFTVSYMIWLFGTKNCPDVHNHQKTSAFASTTSYQHRHC